MIRRRAKNERKTGVLALRLRRGNQRSEIDSVPRRVAAGRLRLLRRQGATLCGLDLLHSSSDIADCALESMITTCMYLVRDRNEPEG